MVFSVYKISTTDGISPAGNSLQVYHKLLVKEELEVGEEYPKFEEI